MNQEDAFLQAICAAPEDDVPRLIYADWLEDHEQAERAEFIRVQIELAGTPEGKRRAALEQRERLLLADPRATRRADLPALRGIGWDEFRRGFVEVVRMGDSAAFLHHADVLFAAAPVREVRFEPGAVRLLRFLVQSPHMARLNALLMCNNGLGDWGTDVLADSRYLRRLTELYLSGNDIGDIGTVALATSPYLARLVELDLRDNRVGDVGVKYLAASRHLARLRTLYLVNNQVGAEGAQALAESAHRAALRHLYLNHNPVGDQGASALAGSPHLAGLLELDLRNADLGDGGARALAESPYLGQLRALYLTGNRIGRETAAALRWRFGEQVRV